MPLQASQRRREPCNQVHAPWLGHWVSETGALGKASHGCGFPSSLLLETCPGVHNALCAPPDMILVVSQQMLPP